jgi:glycosyltransferase involved in cell wall biosynthesis
VVVSSRRSLGFFKEDKPHYRLLERLSNAMTTSVVANSEAVRADAIRQEKLAPEKVVVIHNGVEIAQSPAADVIARLLGELRLEGAKPVVTVIANFLHYKGHGYFFEAWRRVVATYPSAVAVLVGDGPDRARWERWIVNEGMSPTVRFVGSRRDVPAILAVTDIVAHPSLQEGFSNAVLEAMAAARPVIATTVGGNGEAIEDGRTGLLVRARDETALAGAIMDLAANPERARRIGVAARARVVRCFSPQRMVEDYQDLYERLIAGGPVYFSPRVPCDGA